MRHILNPFLVGLKTDTSRLVLITCFTYTFDLPEVNRLALAQAKGEHHPSEKSSASSNYVAPPHTAMSLPHKCGAKGTPPLPHHDHPWTPRCTPGNTLMLPVLADERAGNSKTVIVVPVFGGIPVAIRRTQIPRFVVPRTTT